jgi:hypothetical protein
MALKKCQYKSIEIIDDSDIDANQDEILELKSLSSELDDRSTSSSTTVVASEGIPGAIGMQVRDSIERELDSENKIVPASHEDSESGRKKKKRGKNSAYTHISQSRSITELTGELTITSSQYPPERC